MRNWRPTGQPHWYTDGKHGWVPVERHEPAWRVWLPIVLMVAALIALIVLSFLAPLTGSTMR